MEELKGSILCMDQDNLIEDADINEAIESISAYISFRTDSIIPL